jgi:hypothetical protein
MRKFLFVGVGGSGGKTLRFIKSVLRSRLAEAGYTGPLPGAWQFVQIDLPPGDDTAVGVVPETLGASYKGIAPAGVNYEHHLKQVAGLGDSSLLDDLATWWPDPSDAPKQPWFGAGQYRAVGRLVTLNRLAEIRAAIDSSVTAMELGSATKNFDEIAGALGFEVGAALDEPIAIVIGSMAGGTGAGALLDVCDLLRISGHHGKPFLQMPFGVLYTAAIFGGNGDGAMAGIEPNSLAFAAELSGLLKSDSKSAPIYHAASGAAAVLGERGPALSFLIGRGNGNLVLADSIAVFKSTAQAISAWVLDPGVQALLQSSPVGNLESFSKTKSYFPMHIHETTDRQPVSSFGYAKFGVSRRGFHEYASERLGRMVIEHLLSAHQNIATEGASAKAAIDEVVSPQRLNEFLITCRLNERLKTNDDIINAIRSTASRGMGASAGDSALDVESDIKTQAAEIVNSVLDQAPAGGKGFGAAAANRTLQNRAEERSNFLVSKWDTAFREAGSKWLDEIKPHIVDSVIDTMAVLGLPATIELLQQTDSDLEASMSALQGEASERSRDSKNQFGSLPVDGGKAKVAALVSMLRPKYIPVTAAFFGLEIEARLRLRAVEAIKLLRSSFMGPLIATMTISERVLKAELPLVKEWAIGSLVPDAYRPDPNVVLLLDPEEYSQTFDSLLGKTVGGSGTLVVENAVRAVLTAGEDEVPSGSKRGIAPFISVGGLAAATGLSQISMAADATQIRNRCWRWLSSDPTIGIGQFITSSLQDTLSGASKDEIDRFISKFRAALDRSAPLIDVNPATLNAVHQVSKLQFQRTMSKIPLQADESDKTYQAVVELLVSYGIDEAQIPSMFGKQEGRGELGGDIEFSTFMRAYHPMVFSSFVTPISVAAQTAMGKGDTGFWKDRRSRPLSEYLPLSSIAVGFLARGWLVAAILGELQINSAVAFGHTYLAASLDTPSGRVKFLEPGLGRLPKSGGDVFASILESYPLAEVLFATAQPDAVRGYERLLELGSGVELSTWINDGTTTAGTVEEFVSRDERLRHVVELLDSAESGLNSAESQFECDPMKWELPPQSWEIRSLLLKAIVELRSSVTAAVASGNTSKALPVI